MLDISFTTPQQKKFYSDLEEFIKSGRERMYLSYLEKASAQIGEGIDIDTVLTPLYLLEKKHKLHRKNELKPNFTMVFTHLRDRVVVPSLKNGVFPKGLYLFAELLAETEIKPVSVAPWAEGLKKDVDARMATVDGIAAYCCALFRCILDLLDGDQEDAEKRFVKNLSAIDIDEIISVLGEERFKNEATVLYGTIFGGFESAVELFSSTIFQPDNFLPADQVLQNRMIEWGYDFPLKLCGEQSVFSKYCPIWIDLFKKSLSVGDLETAFSIHRPLSELFHSTVNEPEEIEKFKNEVEIPFSENIGAGDVEMLNSEELLLDL